MPTNRKRRTRAASPPLYESVRRYLLTGDHSCRELLPTDHRGRIEAFRLANPSVRDELREVWRLHRKDILREWAADKREGKPWAATEFDNEQ